MNNEKIQKLIKLLKELENFLDMDNMEMLATTQDLLKQLTL